MFSKSAARISARLSSIIFLQGTSRIEKKDLRGLNAFAEVNPPRLSMVVCNEPRPRVMDDIQIVPWRIFLSKLWSGGLIR